MCVAVHVYAEAGGGSGAEAGGGSGAEAGGTRFTTQKTVICIFSDPSLDANNQKIIQTKTDEVITSSRRWLSDWILLVMGGWGGSELRSTCLTLALSAQLNPDCLWDCSGSSSWTLASFIFLFPPQC